MPDKISIIIPCYNSEKTLPSVIEDIQTAMTGLDVQIILVNDCSSDHVWDVITELCEKNKNIVGLSLSRNFGQQSARMAALEYVTGDYIVFMDDDGQHRAADALRMLDKLKEGYDIVYAYFKKQQKSLFRKFGAYVNKRMTEWVMNMPRNVHRSAFFVTRRYVVESLKNYKTPTPYPLGYFLHITQNITDIEVEHHKRISGHSGYTFRKLIRLWMEGFTGYSVAPLRLFDTIGAIMAAAGVLAGIIIIIQKLVNPSIAAGYTSTISVVLFCSGMIMLMLGMVGEYIGRIFMNVNQFPQYVIKRELNKPEEYEED